MRKWIAVGGWVLLPFVAAALGAQSTDPGYYAALARPDWAPPAWVFGPVWTLLYALMAVAAWLVWRSHRLGDARGALVLYLVQLASNALWSWIFFSWHRGDLAFLEVVILWLLILGTLVLFARRSRTAAVLLVPYLAWVTFAAVLTWVLWQRNPSLLG